ncbi:MAG: YkvA family protein [Burkholderiales bacterium]
MRTWLLNQLDQLKINVTTLWLIFLDSKSWLGKKLLIFAFLCYALSPIDLIPDFIPIVGLLDEIALFPIVIWLIRTFISKSLFTSYQIKATTYLETNKLPIMRIGGYIVVMSWVAIGLVFLANSVER